ncbi:peptidoglycan DD-metalloendopeptidase family protein [Nitratiruptor sp. YY09-18]|uniref:peptidoglycan DD-metalloendopeptidase family protein n=1 Tax=Nitratiruptor sp. YY09-18 TaxID=2724901 RepID=UPI00191666F4|nr:peptidoglycan DD-metalloendopeptidase family protein [Nitratiruptor sp. YY09-18]BCD67479.1 M23 family metallopeptidase [Nitratiruptor sp. YY09-18]
MRKILLLSLFVVLLFAGKIRYEHWKQGQTLLGFLDAHGINAKLYYNLDGEDKELASEIRAGVKFIADYNGTQLLQALIPINEELQIHIFRKNGGYALDLIPIHYQKIHDKFGLAIHSSPYNAIVHNTKNLRLAHEFVAAFKHTVDFTRLHKGDKIAAIYDQKVRLGDFFGMPTLYAAMVQRDKRRYFVFNFEERFYDEKGQELERFLLVRPIPGARITSRFTLKRWHPVLHRYRAHLGVDFGARRGTPIRASGNGRVVFCGRKGGYGNCIIIDHGQGYKTLYAHMSRFRHGMRRGKHVKQGQIIGYVGSTGLSTGPHLHFGLYKNNRAINPLRVVRIAKSRLSGKKLRKFKKIVAKYKKELIECAKRECKPIVIEKVEQSSCQLQGGENAKG